MPKLVWSLLAVVPVTAFAHGDDNFRCSMGGLVRRVEIVHAVDAPAPCAVNYHKDTEAPGQVEELWNAQNDGVYCTARAQEFVARLESWGWQCEVVAIAESAN